MASFKRSAKKSEQCARKVSQLQPDNTIMKYTKILIVSGLVCLSFSQISFAAESELELSVEEQPTFGLFQKMGVKFFLAKVDTGLRKTRYPAAPAWAVDSLEAESASVALLRADVKSKPLVLSNVQFSRDDFQSPGKYYPPKPAIGDTTPIVQISLSANQLTQADASDLLASLVPICSLDTAKVTAWFDAELWDATPHLKLEGKLPKGSTLIYLTKTGEKDSELVFSVSLRIKWTQPTKAEQDAALRVKPSE